MKLVTAEDSSMNNKRYEIRHDDHIWDSEREIYVACADEDVIQSVVDMLNSGKLTI